MSWSKPPGIPPSALFLGVRVEVPAEAWPSLQPRGEQDATATIPPSRRRLGEWGGICDDVQRFFGTNRRAVPGAPGRTRNKDATNGAPGIATNGAIGRYERGPLFGTDHVFEGVSLGSDDASQDGGFLRLGKCAAVRTLDGVINSMPLLWTHDPMAVQNVVKR